MIVSDSDTEAYLGQTATNVKNHAFNVSDRIVCHKKRQTWL